LEAVEVDAGLLPVELGLELVALGLEVLADDELDAANMQVSKKQNKI